jgi:hypothetical protein
MRCPLRTISVFALALVLLLGVGGRAQAACYASDQQLPTQVVSQLVNDPGRLLTQFPDGGPEMIPLIRDLVASDPGSLPLIVSLNAKANPEQIEAIGTGLGQAALVCSRTAQAFATEILRMTLTADNRTLSQAFSAVMGDLFLSLIGPDGASGNGGSVAPSGKIGGADGGGLIFNLPTPRPTWSHTSGAFPTERPGSPGDPFTLGTSGSSNVSSRSVSPSRP